LAIAISSCVKEINPDLKSDDAKKIVISGQLTDLSGYQNVSVSYSSDIIKPTLTHIKNCSVKLESSNGLEYDYTEYQDGEYRVWIDSASLNFNEDYRIVVITPDNQVIKSSWEKFYSCPKIDKAYYEPEIKKGSFHQDDIYGLRFYMDFKGSETDSRYYKLDLVETFEFHTTYPIEWWYDGILHHESPPDYSKSVCYITLPIRDVYVLTTDNLQRNEFKRLKLNFVYNESQRLSHTYSLLYRQMALDFKAFTYWNQMKINMTQEGGLYNNQPIAIKGNLMNTTDTTKDVLGYFTVARAKEYRIFVSGGGFDLIDNTCTSVSLRYGLREILPNMYPAYLMGDETGYQNVLLSEACVDCTSVANGKTTKPDYWP
jgi:hypothetical protein